MAFENESKAWDLLVERYGVSGETLNIVTDGFGYSMETLETVLYAVAGERSFDFEDEDETL